MLQLTVEQIAALPTGVAKAVQPPTVVDQVAHRSLIDLLEEAVATLLKIDANPVAIGSSPCAFNDISISEWRAVRSGRFFIERHDYGPTRTEYKRTLRKAGPGTRIAGETLSRLERSNWRELFTRAYGIEWQDDVLGIAIQDGVPWLVLSGTNNSDYACVFRLWGDEPLAYFGESAERFIHSISDDPPLPFRREPST